MALLSNVATLVGVVGGVIAAWRAVGEMRRGNEERSEATRVRRDELRWRQMEMAKTMVDELYGNSAARSALRMLDWGGRTYPDGERRTGPISYEAMWHALRVDEAFEGDEVFVRDCFDELFDRLGRLEGFVQVGLLRFDDVREPLRYYAAQMGGRRHVFEAFLSAYGYESALRFLDRFPEWRGGVPPGPA